MLQFDDEMSATHFEEVWATAADTAGGGAQVTAVPEIDGHRARVDDRTFIVGRKGNHAFFILGNGGGAVDADANAQHDKLP